MLRFFTYILAAVGFLAVLSHPLTRRGLDALTGLWDKSGSALVIAANKPESTAAVVISTAVPVGAETASLPPEAVGEADAGVETATNGEAEKEAVIQPEAGAGEDAESEAGAESVKVFDIYKTAEADAVYND